MLDEIGRGHSGGRHRLDTHRPPTHPGRRPRYLLRLENCFPAAQVLLAPHVYWSRLSCCAPNPRKRFRPPGFDPFCNPIGAVKRHLFTFFFVLFLCSAEEAVSSSPPTHALELCAQAASRLVAFGGHPKSLASMLPSTVRSYVWCGVLWLFGRAPRCAQVTLFRATGWSRDRAPPGRKPRVSALRVAIVPAENASVTASLGLPSTFNSGRPGWRTRANEFAQWDRTGLASRFLSTPPGPCFCPASASKAAP